MHTIQALMTSVETVIMSKYEKTPEAVAALTPEQYRVTQQDGTERPGTGPYLKNKEPGIYVDIVSGEPLFASSDKYESGCGWPSFTKPIVHAHVKEKRDTSHGMVRIESVCAGRAGFSATERWRMRSGALRCTPVRVLSLR